MSCNIMSVRVVARIRPLLQSEIEKDVIVDAAGSLTGDKNIVRIPNPKKESEAFSFQFNSVYDHEATQAQIFENEVSPTVKHLFKGYDVTLFAYGVTGTGKTHTMRGGRSLADRGVIPRLLSSIYRRARKIEKDSVNASQVEVVMSYYEIYNDRVYDLFEPPEKRTPAGLPIRDTGNGKAQVVGLTERPCSTLKEFEQLYDQANVNRSTSATKLNAHSSRSHAILCVKITQTTGADLRISTASAIDLAGSEDNRRTDNNKDRLVESASINKSLFVLAQCVEAISKKQARIPYRESKMTRILCLGQNNGFTVMILNLAPVRSYHLDTLSSLNFANRTKKIEVNEVENQPFLREANTKSKADMTTSVALNTTLLYRQPLRPKMLSQKGRLSDLQTNVPRPTKQFSVYSDVSKHAQRPSHLANTSQARSTTAALKSPKRPSSEAILSSGRPSKVLRASTVVEPGMSQEAIEALIERKVNEALTERADSTTISHPDPVSEEVRRRLNALERRVEGQETERAQGLQYLLMAKQYQARGEDASALKMYQLALPHFPSNEKLVRKMAALQSKIASKCGERRPSMAGGVSKSALSNDPPARLRRAHNVKDDESYHEAHQLEVPAYEDDDGFVYRPRTKLRAAPTTKLSLASLPPPTGPSTFAMNSEPELMLKHSPLPEFDSEDELAYTANSGHTPRTKYLLAIINSKDVGQIRLLKGLGAKKAEAIVNCLCEAEQEDGGRMRVTSLGQLGKLKGVGVKTVENMRGGVVV